eukprot:6175173-Pleurochrysis_carterae.AAC.3
MCRRSRLRGGGARTARLLLRRRTLRRTRRRTRRARLLLDAVARPSGRRARRTLGWMRRSGHSTVLRPYYRDGSAVLTRCMHSCGVAHAAFCVCEASGSGAMSWPR